MNTESLNNTKRDLFISHASEDKDDFVRPLANLLKDYGVDVWYDEFELRVGVSLSRTINNGIKKSKFGLVVLSKNFFKKNWTEYELKSLNSFEIESGDILLPIWKDVTFNEVREFDSYLADKFALNSTNGIEEVAVKIIEVVRPDLFSKIHRERILRDSIKNNPIFEIEASKLKRGPIQHLKLSDNLISRIRLIRASLWLCFPDSMANWMDGFQRDILIEQEVRYWECIGSVFLEIIFQHEWQPHYKGKKEEIYNSIFLLLFTLTNSKSHKGLEVFSDEFQEKVKEILSYNLPIYDIGE